MYKSLFQEVPTHLDFDSGLEADAVGDSGLEVGDGVELLLYLRRNGRLGEVVPSRLRGGERVRLVNAQQESTPSL